MRRDMTVVQLVEIFTSHIAVNLCSHVVEMSTTTIEYLQYSVFCRTILETVAVYSSETLVTIYPTTRCQTGRPPYESSSP
jgi:hypothetical protein